MDYEMMKKNKLYLVARVFFDHIINLFLFMLVTLYNTKENLICLEDIVS
ncbi:hypothetical protein AW25_1155 [Francisella tularensis subsp. novicida U112]|nr:hypothetical protein FNFX1_0875 [Francisella cf. novicida Fx1]AJI46259.1 hypothetical protein AS84_1630 [Francisella tularensis subsp. novicida F6168]AJI61799.1 hypothetical protein AW25_1155 [Francisella tularensis subsp. novicida U112]AJJ46679.1 hypothetical protein CH70_1104 [Francisella tularensis subsp. novicida]EDX27335.1 hypothetical protein FTE_1106 [Francisella tularensis subsp. novicida FTE]